MNVLLSLLQKSTDYNQLLKAVEAKQAVAVSGLSQAPRSHVLAAAHEQSGRPLVAVCQDDMAAKRLASELGAFLGEEPPVLPSRELTLAGAIGVSRQWEQQRLRLLYALAQGRVPVLVASLDALLLRTLPRQTLFSASVTLRVGAEYSMPELIERLTRAGYSRASLVEGVGQFALRGGILDVYSPAQEKPLRAEFFGDELDTMGYFDPITQRRTENVDEAVLLPVAETEPHLHPQGISGLCEDLRAIIARQQRRKTPNQALIETLQKDCEALENETLFASADRYMALIYPEFTTAASYLPQEAVVAFCDHGNLQRGEKDRAEEFGLLLDSFLTSGTLFGELCDYYATMDDLAASLRGRAVIYCDSFLAARYPESLPPKQLLSFTARQLPGYGGSLETAAADLKNYASNQYGSIVLCGGQRRGEILKELLAKSGLNALLSFPLTKLPQPGQILIAGGSLPAGLEYPTLKFAILTEGQIAVRQERKRVRAPKKATNRKKLDSFTDLTPGDLVVHEHHGIGRYVGMEQLKVGGVTKDYVKIAYQGTDCLYVPATQLDLVSKYIGAGEDTPVRLNKLGGDQWQKTKAKAKAAAKDLAAGLIKLYAERKRLPGFAFAADSPWQQEFEESFEYAETDDQLRCIDEIKRDMESPAPMDRLLCGDVGFGKTEVALRAAMKCMLDGKQCAVLVPTTVLAWQHYQSALKRFEHFPFKIELLSRFRTKKQQEEILKQVALGTVDMVIGTHRLVQKDVKFKDLGLAIIDEEQRFGVAHKERFKEAFTGVDVLTLSATPIPRTLNMAMSGIRDMSVIEEPPVDRYPVQTYVIEHNMGVIIQAINKELRRGGQVYYIHNRVETIDLCAAKIAELIPDARIAVAHGQLSEERLSDIWTELVDHEIDILVCTTIIETGVDVPNVNTLIIEDADNLGLSQLYQLRGRVGRSNRRAFAYFTFRRGKVLTEIASKRLDAIREFTQFGSGFRVAMRDLEIRGAGSILGGRQHGHMEAVGYDMYLQLLNEAIAEETGQTPPRTPEECLIDLQIEAHIPDDYIESLAGRLDAYRKIAAVSTKEESIDLLDEFIDRYGDPPKAIQGLVTVALTRNMAGKAGITEITQRSNALLIYVKTAGMEQVQALVKAFGGRVSVNGSADKPYIAIKLTKTDRPVEIMQTAVETFYEAGEQAKKTK